MQHFSVILAYLVACASALHVFVGENGSPACFDIDLGRDALLSETHSAWELQPETNSWTRDDNLVIEVSIDEKFDSNHRVYHHKSRPFANAHFVAHDGGEHRICYRALKDGWWVKNRVKLEVDFAVSTGSDVADTQGERRLGYLADRVSEVARKFVHINREQRLMREREMSFRDSSEKANSRVAFMTFLQLIVLGGTCAWQVNHLRSFFVKQKLV